MRSGYHERHERSLHAEENTDRQTRPDFPKCFPEFLEPQSFRQLACIEGMDKARNGMFCAFSIRRRKFSE